MGKIASEKKNRHYKTEGKLYFILLLLSMLIIGASFLAEKDSRCFTIIAGFGCSGVASVAVAWLLDIATCKRKEEANRELLDHMFSHFDSTVQYELNCILESCAKRNQKIDLDKEYSVHEVAELMEKTDENLSVWEKSYHNFGVAFSSVDASPLLSYDPIPQHNEIYTIVKVAQENHRSYDHMTTVYRIENKSNSSIAHIFLGGDVSGAESIFKLREKTIMCSVSEDGKSYIRSLRKSMAEKHMGRV